jgi:hypothetical protein
LTIRTIMLIKLRARSSTGQSARIRPDLAVTGAILGLLTLVIVLAIRREAWMHRPVVGRGAVRLTAVRPDAGDTLFDPSGKRLESRIYDGLDVSAWPTQFMRRDFVFDLDSTGAGQVTATLRIDLPMSYLNLFPVQVYDRPDGGKRLVGQTRIPRYYWKHFPLIGNRKRPVERVAGALLLYEEHSGRFDTRFTGPFEPGTTLTDSNGMQLLMEPVRHDPRAGIKFKLLSPEQTWGSRQLYVADRRGGKIDIQSSAYRSQTNGFSLEVQIQAESLQAIAEVALLRPLEIPFSNVQVVYPGRPERNHPEFIDVLAAMWDLTSQPYFTTSPLWPVQDERSTLEVIDLVRGRFVLDAWQTMVRARTQPSGSPDFSRLPEELQMKAHHAAHAWIETDNPRVQAAGIGLGLLGGEREFVARGLQLLSNTETSVRSSALESLLLNPSLILNSEVREIAAALGKIEDAANLRTLLGLVARCRNPVVAGKIFLPLACDHRTEIWWNAVRAWPEKDWIRTGLLPADFRWRLVAVYGPGQQAAEETLKTVRDRLPGLLTLRLLSRDRLAFNGLLRRLGEEGESSLGTSALTALLQAMKEPELEEAVAATMVRILNLWHHRDFGGFGNEPKAGPIPHLEASRWRALIQEILAWHSE